MRACPHCGGPSAADATGFEPSGRGYPEHYPQQDHGHATNRPKPQYAPAWFLARTHPDADAHGLLRE